MHNTCSLLFWYILSIFYYCNIYCKCYKCLENVQWSSGKGAKNTKIGVSRWRDKEWQKQAREKENSRSKRISFVRAWHFIVFVAEERTQLPGEAGKFGWRLSWNGGHGKTRTHAPSSPEQPSNVASKLSPCRYKFGSPRRWRAYPTEFNKSKSWVPFVTWDSDLSILFCFFTSQKNKY